MTAIVGNVPVMRRSALFSPYELNAGGGERYLLAMASVLQRYGHVELLAPEVYSELRVDQVARDLGVRLRRRLRVGKFPVHGAPAPYDFFVAMGNEAFPPVPGLGRVNIFMCQFPFPQSRMERATHRPHDARYHRIIVNSEYTRRALLSARRHLGITRSEVSVVNPPCRVPDAAPAARAFDGVVRIASVGRFFTSGHAKRQDLMIAALRRLVRDNRGPTRYELHLVGTASVKWGSREYLDSLEKRAAGLPVVLHVNATEGRLREVLDRADIYWHATGLGASARRHPERLEHFGISVVEAMGAGCVPIVFRGGGLLEIVAAGRTGYTFGSISELVAASRQHAAIVAGDPEQTMTWRRTVWEDSRRFSEAAFADAFIRVVDELEAKGDHAPSSATVPTTAGETAATRFR